MASGKQHILAKRYARALFDVCSPQDFDRVDEQLRFLKDIWQGSSEFRDAMQNPSVSERVRKDILVEISQSIGGWATKPLGELVSALVSLGKTAALDSVSDIFSKMVREYKKSLALEVTVAKPLTEAGIADLKAKLSASIGGEVEVTVAHDPEILGGMTIRMGDTLLDRSVAGTLKQIAGELV
jgi:F-type H+-transporting ATPase subunit delta